MDIHHVPLRHRRPGLGLQTEEKKRGKKIGKEKKNHEEKEMKCTMTNMTKRAIKKMEKELQQAVAGMTFEDAARYPAE